MSRNPMNNMHLNIPSHGTWSSPAPELDAGGDRHGSLYSGKSDDVEREPRPRVPPGAWVSARTTICGRSSCGDTFWWVVRPSIVPRSFGLCCG